MQTHVLHCEEFDFVVETGIVNREVDNQLETRYTFRYPDGGDQVLELTKDELVAINRFRLDNDK